MSAAYCINFRRYDVSGMSEVTSTLAWDYCADDACSGLRVSILILSSIVRSPKSRLSKHNKRSRLQLRGEQPVRGRQGGAARGQTHLQAGRQGAAD